LFGEDREERERERERETAERREIKTTRGE
jgi:hypothetical protein